MRIKLTHKDIQVIKQRDGFTVEFTSLEGYPIEWTKEDAVQLKAQLPEDHEKANNWDLVKSGVINTVVQYQKLEQESKELKEELSRTVGDFLTLKQKLSKIEEWLAQEEDYDKEYLSKDQLRRKLRLIKTLKAILEGKS